MVLIRSHFSLISPGTEGSTVRTARKSLLAKALERPEQVRQVVDALKQQGPIQTYRAVMKKLDSYSPLGYSVSGKVVAVAADVAGLVAGDPVACAGAGYACHAEYVAVPRNLCVRLPGEAHLESAAYNTLGAIAMQGVRQADLRLGETCVVVGLGLLGHLTALILRASGVHVIGADIDPDAVAHARKHCCGQAFTMSDPRLLQQIEDDTGNIGADAVIITAATDSVEPVNLAGRVARHRGTIVIVGDVPTGFDREPDYYRKELNLRMSCSYGPGRYDPQYEELGVDYPAGYVRWTENRNMQAFQALLHGESIDVSYLTGHRFTLDEAPRAYDLIVAGKQKILGAIIRYDTTSDPRPASLVLGTTPVVAKTDKLKVSFIGAGSYAMSHLLPNVAAIKGVSLSGVMTSSGTSSRTVADKYGFEFATPDVSEILDPTRTSVVFIATRHDSHAGYVKLALMQGLSVFVEKPLCITPGEQTEIDDLYATLAAAGKAPQLMVGFNRRFAPLAASMKDAVGEGPMAMTYRVNAGHIPANSWIQDPQLGGGRIVGEVCHFVDLLTWLNGSLPVSVYAGAVRGAVDSNDTLNAILKFANGSSGVIGYYATGAKALRKEYVEAHRSGISVVLDDFHGIQVYEGSRVRRQKSMHQNKGQRRMVESFIAAARGEAPAPIDYSHLRAVTRATFAIGESMRSGKPVLI